VTLLQVTRPLQKRCKKVKNAKGCSGGDVVTRGKHGQDQDWISCRILAIFSDRDWIWILIFEKKWIRTGSGYLFDFYNEISLSDSRCHKLWWSCFLCYGFYIHKKSE